MCKNKNYSISFTTEQFLMLYSIVLQITHEMYKAENNKYNAKCFFSFDEKKGEEKIFKELLDKFINFRERRLTPPRDGRLI